MNEKGQKPEVLLDLMKGYGRSFEFFLDVLGPFRI
jgi:hypothetical protein